ncbi:MAG: hypothetical protein PHH40_03485 [Candidatus Moranbacteria bacterium]|nr:hypothetical protein [Candidatus Moranbacteria bacterium]MDD3964690.1 hypothetical protein [Candidatus Moranbacteria bacterium]
MSLENPFSKKTILPPEETNPESNIKLIKAFLGTDSAEAYRKTLAEETTKPQQKPDFHLDNFDEKAFEQHNQVEQEEAETLFGENFLGPKEFQEAFGFTPEDVPPIPFSREDLKDAQEKGLTLCLNWDMLPDGTKLSGKKMTELLGSKQQNGDLLIGIHFNSNDPTYTEETPRRGWALVSNTVEYKNQNYLEQTDSLRKECSDTEVYRQAIKEYETQKPHIEKLWQNYHKNWKEISRILNTLTITALTRDSFSERFQYMVLINQKIGTRIHESEYYWTSSRSSGGDFVNIGHFDRGGAVVGRDDPEDPSSNVGVCFSRRY